MQDRSQQPDQPGASSPADDQLREDALDAGDALEADTPHEELSPDAGPEQTAEARTEPVRVDLGAPPAPAPAQAGPGRRIPFISRDRSVGSPAQPRSYVSRDSSWFWPLINLVGLAAVVLINWLANWVPFNDQTTGDIADRAAVPFQPAGWAFSIWGLIYLLLFVFVVYGFLPAGRNNPRVQAVGPFFLVANLANIAWLFFWHWEQFGAALITMAVLLAALIGIYAVVRRRGKNGPEVGVAERLVVWTPFSVYAGWISVAILANVQVWMRYGGWDGGPFGLRGWSVIFLLASVLVAAGVGFFFHDAVYTLVFVWGFLGIAQEQWDASKLVSVTAILLVIVAAAVTVMAFMLAFDARTMQGRSFSLRRRGTPAPPTGI